MGRVYERIPVWSAQIFGMTAVPRCPEVTNSCCPKRRDCWPALVEMGHERATNSGKRSSSRNPPRKSREMSSTTVHKHGNLVDRTSECMPWSDTNLPLTSFMLCGGSGASGALCLLTHTPVSTQCRVVSCPDLHGGHSHQPRGPAALQCSFLDTVEPAATSSADIICFIHYR